MRRIATQPPLTSRISGSGGADEPAAAMPATVTAHAAKDACATVRAEPARSSAIGSVSQKPPLPPEMATSNAAPPHAMSPSRRARRLPRTHLSVGGGQDGLERLPAAVAHPLLVLGAGPAADAEQALRPKEVCHHRDVDDQREDLQRRPLGRDLVDLERDERRGGDEGEVLRPALLQPQAHGL